jgi:hypothetical protein
VPSDAGVCWTELNAYQVLISYHLAIVQGSSLPVSPSFCELSRVAPAGAALI